MTSAGAPVIAVSGDGSWFGLAASALASLTSRQRILALTYHRVLPRPDPMRPFDMTAADFELQVATLARRFRLLTLRDAYARLAAGEHLTRTIALTFDDGYADNHDIALPILTRYGAAGTFFVATGFTAGERMWNDAVIDALGTTPHERLDLGALGLESVELGSAAQRRAAAARIIVHLKHRPPAERAGGVERLLRLADVHLAEHLMMNPEQIRSLARADMEIGGHTVTHPILNAVTDAEAQREIVDGKRDLEQLLDTRVTSFAYPNGRPGADYSARHVEMTRAAGFQIATSTVPGCIGPRSDPLQLPRIAPWAMGAGALQARLAWWYREPQVQPA
jgi:peptidoglycan/xylan/chitin deacetylase (PgdA/CDA1 family)